MSVWDSSDSCQKICVYTATTQDELTVLFETYLDSRTAPAIELSDATAIVSFSERCGGLGYLLTTDFVRTDGSELRLYETLYVPETILQQLGRPYNVISIEGTDWPAPTLELSIDYEWE